MELKPYQQKVIKDLELFLQYLQEKDKPSAAYNSFWEDKVGPYSPQIDGSFKGMRPYKDNVTGATHIAIKVPTAGGKTFIACNALHTINKHMSRGNPKAVIWLVPWSNLLQQTYNNLSNPSHPYREKLNTLFNGRVEVYDKESLLQGANFNPSSVAEQLNIFVFNFSSLRINSRKKDDRKVYQENGAYESFRESVIDKNLVLPDTDETALINVIRSLNPVVIVDESHNAESDLSVEMLNNLNPSLVLDLTATPKSNSNIISFVNAIELKKEHMVKLPVVVYNHNRKEEVITSALHLQRKLELHAQEEEKVTGRYIRPIILFQAQSNIKGKNNTTFQKIKDNLVKLRIPEEQIKIKVSGIDELKDIDLTSRNCPVRYIITVNALKEGWDCPNAYILASLADKSSPVEVEQILGRVLRQPYVTKHQNALLNLSFVLTASAKFNETLDNIVEGLQESGFSRDDYYAEEAPEEEKTENEVLQEDLFGDSTHNKPVSDDDFAVSDITFDPDEKVTLESLEQNQPEIVSYITGKAKTEGKAFETIVKNTEVDDDTALMTQVMGKKPKTYKVIDQYKEVLSNLKLPQFYLKQEHDSDVQSVLFEEAASYDTLLQKEKLLTGFNLTAQDSNVNFDEITADIRTIDFNEEKKSVEVGKMQTRTKSILLENILAKPKASQIKDVTYHIVSRLGDMYPIPEQDLQAYVSRIFNSLEKQQIQDVITNDINYVRSIRDHINNLTSEYSKIQFKHGIAIRQIFTDTRFELPESITPLRTSTSIAKSLYQLEGHMNNFERDMITDIQSMNNVLFWHRNLDRGKGFFLNGFSSNHYPDFIVYTKSDHVILIETKGDDRDNDDSRDKNRLGQAWDKAAGNQFSYFMVFQTKEVEDCYTAKSIIGVVKNL
ncbi:type III restriction enzyme [Nonlabens sp. Hel1_33_55]|uniref:DEAD/DEAH box helicase n=1 Tax=Nonlabens sp. Hel1_33_55 TaxID=1336802 RepID=UPI000875B513|nr:DEAD/DEAH box helicase family protein [Nonlabens sp. Hel1_33_55]SCY36703.1 type III restriction enzyme [Nonlabens sp. Hel1_33_55]